MSMTYAGVFGTALVFMAYMPQILHLLKGHCAAGISLQAYAIWSVGSLLLLIHAVLIQDPVFMTVQSYQLGTIILIAFFARKYKHSICEGHRLQALGTHEH